MGKIALIAPGEEIARYGRQLKATLNSPDHLTIINAHMEDAVKKARTLIKAGDIDVLISRGTTGKLLERANLNIPCTMIPVGEHEVLACIQQAKKITGLSSPHLGFLDFDSYITPLTPFLSALNIPVSEYTLHSSEEIPELIRRSKADHCDVLIGGRLCFEEAQKRQIPSVPMGSSLDSLRLAYRQARKLQQAVNLEKQKAQEQKTILAGHGYGQLLSVLVLVDHSEVLRRNPQRYAVPVSRAAPGRGGVNDRENILSAGGHFAIADGGGQIARVVVDGGAARADIQRR